MINRRTEPATESWTDDRGVTEVLAFILVFATIFGSIGLLYMTGFQAMSDYQEVEQQVNAERAMDALADNFNDVIRYDGVNQRYGELALREGTVTTGDSGTKLDIIIEDIDGDVIEIGDNDRFAHYSDDATVDLGEFSYTSDGSTIAYEGGGLVRSDDSGEWSTVSKQPQLNCGDNAATISLVAVSSESRSLQSSEGLGVTMSVENRTTKVYNDVEDVTIEIDESETEYDAAWKSTLENWGGSETLEETCELGGGQLVVTFVEVDIDY
ncbi:hypothetical protein GS429_18405 [Natronorubrum sp. JWXQ-INN-674]|uniref:Uncharacterized protein n=1 Tax=Natronorubrum halalkaliphilum TaxID=2691917 RepID=A0A6B0VR61_9EURY|nr:hypothetical protein [Natronorubrum halalkaliphilum]MXV63998.1 hypothetical protein [Natronorubrum halalkaliphilum]